MASLSTPRIGILGAAGRMGRTLIEAVNAAGPALQLAALVESSGHPLLGRALSDADGALVLADDWSPEAVDVLIDFTRPEATLATLEKACRSGTAMVIGTTGFDAGGRRALDTAARQIALCESGNFSVGIHLLQQLVRQAAAALGSDFDIEIVEAHHRYKVDAPSGTALMLGRAAAAGAQTDFDAQAVYARQGHTGPRPRGSLGFATVRGGDVVGDHTVLFLGDGERLELTHKASSRMNFARGAVRAAAALAGRPAGRYGLDEVFG
ncbi:4-hydroxy-tetrahydrodipicolinate reductase [Polycyclovorans algicola]|uniref:4-hydroxy-tetrahydrodipicolinate reductase n=1 Tax=Polycyclovorans algicola TaxID=616992 RepID=UPI0004A6BE45|nr:4-hydroxy-tetrahydrodipicolinate reductase [Polycyclovorans algicola]